MTHRIIQGPYILRPRDRIYSVDNFSKNKTVYFQLWTVYFPLMTVYFKLKTVYFPPGPYIFGPRPYILRHDRIYCQDRIFSRTVYFQHGSYISRLSHKGVNFTILAILALNRSSFALRYMSHV